MWRRLIAWLRPKRYEDMSLHELLEALRKGH